MSRSTLRAIKVRLLWAHNKVQRALWGISGREYVPILHWVIPNWGDAINRDLVTAMSHRPVLSVDIEVRRMGPVPPDPDRDVVYSVVGSILDHADKATIVWGSGLMKPKAPADRPKEICAVRGPHTARTLKESGISCPEVYGDPTLLLPRFYLPDIDPIYEIGIVAHRKDWNNQLLERFRDAKNIRLINMKKTGRQIIDQICSCRCVVSSSLHGLIVADAYGIPAGWIHVSDRIFGSDFKYHDYHASIRVDVPVPLRLSGRTKVSELREITALRTVALDLDRLYESCPFKGASLSDGSEHLWVVPDTPVAHGGQPESGVSLGRTS